MIKIKHKDLDKILVVMKYMMDERPDLNEKLMEFYCYLLDMKSIHKVNPNESQVIDSQGESKRITVDESEGVDMNLDEMIWNLGMNLPSWDNDSTNDSTNDSRGESNDKRRD